MKSLFTLVAVALLFSTGCKKSKPEELNKYKVYQKVAARDCVAKGGVALWDYWHMQVMQCSIPCRAYPLSPSTAPLPESPHPSVLPH